MTDESASTPSVESNAQEGPFNRADLAFFDSEDAEAGTVIGKMLTTFFFYTVAAMSIIVYWTWNSLQ